MNISTKKGDRGTTTLSEDGRILKNDMRFMLLGDIDELNSHLGLIKALTDSRDEKEFLEWIQKCLIRAGSHIYNMQEEKYFLLESEAKRLEDKVHELSVGLEITGFVLYGANVLSAQYDIARTIARRAERRFVTVGERYTISDFTLSYFNRLSDFLYMCARVKEKPDLQERG